MSRSRQKKCTIKKESTALSRKKSWETSITLCSQSGMHESERERGFYSKVINTLRGGMGGRHDSKSHRLSLELSCPEVKNKVSGTGRTPGHKPTVSRSRTSSNMREKTWQQETLSSEDDYHVPKSASKVVLGQLSPEREHHNE